MTIKPVLSVLFGLMLSGRLIASSATAQPNNFSKHNSQVQHLTCVKDLQKLSSIVDGASNTAKSLQQTTASKLSAPEFIKTDLLAQVSNLLLGIIYLVLPIALVLTVLVHDKRDVERIQLIERLERIWAKRSPP